MRSHSSLLLHAALAAASAAALLGSTAPAARGHWGGGWGHGGWGHGCWGHGFYRPYYGFGPGAFGLGLGLGYGLGYGMGGYYRPYYGGYMPYYGVYAPPVYSPVVAAPTVASASYPVSTGAPTGSQTPPDNAAHLQLTVPQEADVWFAGVRIAREGRVREFVSPPLTAGQSYTYQVVVRYTDTGGKPVEDKRDIQVRANDWFSIDFTRPPPTEKPNLVPPPSP